MAVTTSDEAAEVDDVILTRESRIPDYQTRISTTSPPLWSCHTIICHGDPCARDTSEVLEYSVLPNQHFRPNNSYFMSRLLDSMSCRRKTLCRFETQTDGRCSHPV